MKKKNKYAKIDMHSYEKDFKKDMKNKKFREGFFKEKLLLDIAVELSRQRKNKHLSQRQLAKLANMKQQAIARIEMGNENVTIGTLSKLAAGLNKKLTVKFS